ncbi:ABC transporter ATP-binding protein [uncultured Enterovirga sp.]|uniref:ABC transporter ATP-binding protein n=1 Tax=uncultured Enterovirga sp. TaxID=2026352 RepID=UPI0035C9692A
MSVAGSTVLAVNDLSRRFDVSRPWPVRLLTGEGRREVHALDRVSFEISRGTTLAIVGESGCGKTTLAKLVAGLLRPSEGAVSFKGVDIAGFRTRHAALPYRRHLQMIFQDPQSSLDPRWRVGRIVAEPIRTHRLLPTRAAIATRVGELLDAVGLSGQDRDKFPHQFSGGQRQRIAIARALAGEPDFIVCDEPTSALDVSVQAQILNLMRALQRRLGLSYLLISHNLAVVANMADRIGVMYLGRLVEIGDAADVLDEPLHPYTRLLLDTVPDMANPGRTRAPLAGEVPSPLRPPSGCHFHPRCPLVAERCRREAPPPTRRGSRSVACHAVEEGRLPPRDEEESRMSA